MPVLPTPVWRSAKPVSVSALILTLSFLLFFAYPFFLCVQKYYDNTQLQFKLLCIILCIILFITLRRVNMNNMSQLAGITGVVGEEEGEEAGGGGGGDAEATSPGAAAARTEGEREESTVEREGGACVYV